MKRKSKVTYLLQVFLLMMSMVLLSGCDIISGPEKTLEELAEQYKTGHQSSVSECFEPIVALQLVDDCKKIEDSLLPEDSFNSIDSKHALTIALANYMPLFREIMQTNLLEDSTKELFYWVTVELEFKSMTVDKDGKNAKVTCEVELTYDLDDDYIRNEFVTTINMRKIKNKWLIVADNSN